MLHHQRLLGGLAAARLPRPDTHWDGDAFLTVTNLNTAQYQVCYQFKLVVTAVLSVIMLKRSLSKAQWM
eukprot:COSAG01_NODE_7986_length_2964_cov_3.300873_2_plen_69_part_00